MQQLQLQDKKTFYSRIELERARRRNMFNTDDHTLMNNTGEAFITRDIQEILTEDIVEEDSLTITESSKDLERDNTIENNKYEKDLDDSYSSGKKHRTVNEKRTTGLDANKVYIENSRNNSKHGTIGYFNVLGGLAKIVKSRLSKDNTDSISSSIQNIQISKLGSNVIENNLTEHVLKEGDSEDANPNNDSLFNPGNTKDKTNYVKQVSRLKLLDDKVNNTPSFLKDKSKIDVTDVTSHNVSDIITPENKRSDKIKRKKTLHSEYNSTHKELSMATNREMTGKINMDEIKNNLNVNVQMILIDNLRFGQYTFYCLCILSCISDRAIYTEYSDKLCKHLMLFTKDEEGMSRCKYPILLCALAAEFLYRLGRLNVKYQYKCNSVAEVLLQLGENLQSSIKDEEMLSYYLREQTDFKNRSALEIIAENKFYDLLKDENVASIVSKLWYGKGKEISLFNFCRITRIINSHIKHEHYDDVIKRTYNEVKTKNYSFQYNQYINNCSVRYQVDSFSTLLTTIFYQYIIYYYVSLTKEGIESSTDTLLIRLNYIANIIVYSINLNMIFYLIYVYKINRPIKLDFWIILDVIMFTAVLLNFTNFSLSIGLDSQLIHLVDALIYSVIIVCAWLRVIKILMTTRTFGPTLRIIYLLLWPIMSFILVFFALNTVFAQVFTLLFKDTDNDFNSFFSSWVTLYQFSFGVTNFQGFSSMKIFGYILTMIYITITNLILLNLIIAIVNNLYSFFKEKADAENRSVLVISYERIKWHDEYGLLILLPAPFNLFTSFFIFILLITPEEKRAGLNTFFSKIAYIIVALGNFLILLICSILLFPFAYFKSLIHSGYDNYSSFSFADIFRIFFTLITRFLILLRYIVEDIFNFWRICYKHHSDAEGEKKSGQIDKEIIYSVRNILAELKYFQNKRIIDIETVYKMLGLTTTGKGGEKADKDSTLNYSDRKLLDSKTNSVSSGNINAALMKLNSNNK
jgi:hypothetical protein